MEVLKAAPRTETGSRKAGRLRRNGLVPAIIYGHKQAPEAISLGEHDVELAIQHGERLMEVEIDGRKQTVLLKEVQYDSLGQEILHLDLARVDLDEMVEVTVPLILRGTPAGAADGGVLTQNLMALEIECMVRSIPEDIRVSVADMKVDDVLKISDIKLPEGARLLIDPDTIVCSVTVVAEEELAAAEEGPTQPEVIGEKKEEEEGAEGSQ